MTNAIAFIDQRLLDSSQLASLLAAMPAGLELVFLDPSAAGLEQILGALQPYTDLQTIHLLGHGSAAQLLLGSSLLSPDTLSAQAEQWQAIGLHLAASGDLLLYGCELASSDSGLQLIQQLARLSSADVAASTNLTGSGGDWVLEASTGRIESDSLQLGELLGSLGNFFGTSAAESLSGTSSADYMDGAGGNDTLRALDGDDLLWGADGNDLLDAGSGDDMLDGEAGNDSLYGGDGQDYLSDRAGSNLLDGGAGDDTLYGDSGSTLLGGTGSDDLIVDGGNNLLDGGEGADSLFGGIGNNTLRGGDGDDYLQADAGDNSIDGGAGMDTLWGNTGNDTLDGGSGADFLYGDAGDDLYVVDHLDDEVVEQGPAWDIDSLLVMVDDFVLPAGIEQVSYGEGVRALPYFIQGLASGSSWAGIGNGYSVSYSFVQTASGGYSNANAYTAAEKAAVRSALAQYSALTQLTFNEQADDSAADVRFFQHDISDASGYAYYLGDVHLGNAIDGSAGDSYLMLHEIGHSMGLKHSFESPALPSAEDSQANTLMSYNTWWPLPDSLQMFDIATLHYLYGVNPDANSGNQSWSIDQRYIYDGGGNDTLTAAGHLDDVLIDLRPGSWNFAGSLASSILADGQSFLGFGSWIENAIGGSGNDSLSGNNLGNQLDGGNGHDSLLGAEGDDSLYGGSGDDSLDGGSGNDWLDGGSGNDLYRLQIGSGQDTLDASQAGNGSDLLQLGSGLTLDDLLLSRPQGSDNLLIALAGHSDSLQVQGFFAGSHSSLDVQTSDASLLSDSQLRLRVTGVEPASVSISGTPQEGQTLQASTDLSDPQQLASLSLQWWAGEQLLGTGSSLLLTRAMVGQQLQVRASYEVSGLGTQYASSALSSSILVLNSTPTGSLQISGTAEVGATLQAVNGLQDADGLGSFSYQWLANGDPISGASTSSFTLTAAQFGSQISLRVRWTDGYGSNEEVVSPATAAVTAVNHDPQGSVSITGTPRAGAWLSASSSLSDADGMGPLSFQWLRDGNPIDGATSSQLQLTRSEVDRDVSVRVSYTDGFGNLTTLTSSAVSVQPWALGSRSNKASGTDLDDWMQGEAGNDRLYGLDGDDVLDGGDGNDRLYGGSGSNSLIGGLGNDRFYVDSSTDLVVEAVDGGLDLIYSSVSYQIAANVEKLILTGIEAIDASGDEADNLLYGNSGNNLIDGGAGADYMAGGRGADTYVVDNLGDVIKEKGNDFDRVESSVSWVMAKKVEALQLTGSADLYAAGNTGHEQITGNSGSNLLYGLKGNDSLDGGAGNDSLNGGLGADQLTGGAGNDVFVFASLKDSTLKLTAMDSILDFSHGSDLLDLSLLDANSKLTGDQAFDEFIASDALFTRAGQLRMVGDILYGNTDADSSAEFAIRLVGIEALDLADLIA